MMESWPRLSGWAHMCCAGEPPLVAPSPAGSKESLFSCTLTASEEAMAALEEVVLYAFQQCVYYLSKVCAALLGPWGRRE